MWKETPLTDFSVLVPGRTGGGPLAVQVTRVARGNSGLEQDQMGTVAEK